MLVRHEIWQLKTRTLRKFYSAMIWEENYLWYQPNLRKKKRLKSIPKLNIHPKLIEQKIFKKKKIDFDTFEYSTKIDISQDTGFSNCKMFQL